MAGRKYMFSIYLNDDCEEVTGVDRCKGCQYSFRVKRRENEAKRYFCEKKLHQMCLAEEKERRMVALGQDIYDFIETYGRDSFREVLMNCGLNQINYMGSIKVIC